MKTPNLSVDELVSGIHSGAVKVVEVRFNYSIKDNIILGLVGKENTDLLEQNYGLLQKAVSERKIGPAEIKIYRCDHPVFRADRDRLIFSGDLLERGVPTPFNLMAGFDFVKCGSELDNLVVALRYDNYLIIKR